MYFNSSKLIWFQCLYVQDKAQINVLIEIVGVLEISWFHTTISLTMSLSTAVYTNGWRNMVAYYHESLFSLRSIPVPAQN